MHNLRILVRFINGRVVAPYCDAAVGIVVAERLCMCALGHDALSKMLVERKNGIVICMIELLGSLQDFLWAERGKSGVVWLVLWQLVYRPIIPIPKKLQSNGGFKETLDHRSL